MKPDNPLFKSTLPVLQSAANALQLELQQFDAPGPSEFEAAFSAMAKRSVDAIVFQEDAVFLNNLKTIAELAAKLAQARKVTTKTIDANADRLAANVLPIIARYSAGRALAGDDGEKRARPSDVAGAHDDRDANLRRPCSAVSTRAGTLRSPHP